MADVLILIGVVVVLAVGFYLTRSARGGPPVLGARGEMIQGLSRDPVTGERLPVDGERKLFD